MGEALPLWMRTFQPMPVLHRRLLFPVYYFEQNYSGDSDDISLGSSWGVSPTKLNFEEEELIADKLDPETRTQTTFLTTLYFTSKFFCKKKNQIGQDLEQEACAFVEKYGAYLKLHSSLVAASKAHSSKITDNLLEVAKHDPKHIEMMKELAAVRHKKNPLVLYVPAMLSAILVCLKKSLFVSFHHEQVVLSLLTSAYPDLQPWQVKDGLSSYYYNYLTLLLDVSGGSDIARKDKELMKEWCTLSIMDESDVDRMANFKFVALNTEESMANQLYYRDLPMLLDLSMNIHDYFLSLSLVEEIVKHRKYSRDKQVILAVIENLHVIAQSAINQRTEELHSCPILHRVIRCFNCFTESPISSIHHDIDVSDQYLCLLNACENEAENIHSCVTGKQIDIVKLLADYAKPKFALKALTEWSAINVLPVSVVVPALQNFLKRCALEGFRDELSGSLFRLRCARQIDGFSSGKDDLHEASRKSNNMPASLETVETSESISSSTVSSVNDSSLSSGTIWQKLQNGQVYIEK